MKSRMTDGATRRATRRRCLLRRHPCRPSRVGRRSPLGRRPFLSPPPARSQAADQPLRSASFLLLLSASLVSLLANEEGAGRGGRPFARDRAAAAGRLSSLDVAGLLHRGLGAGLSLGERLVDGHRSGERGREVWPASVAMPWNWGSNELNACIRNRLHSRMQRISRIDPFQRHIRERSNLQYSAFL